MHMGYAIYCNLIYSPPGIIAMAFIRTKSSIFGKRQGCCLHRAILCKKEYIENLP